MFNHDPLSSTCEFSIFEYRSAPWLQCQLLTICRIDVPRRLRRAILLNDLPLVQRIIRNNPDYLRNPDYEDKSNTNLHLAAKHGFTQIAVCFLRVRLRHLESVAAGRRVTGPNDSQTRC